MKPIGTITNYFSFLEEETKDVLSSIMDAATNYYDFVLRLGEKVYNEEVSSEVAYIGALKIQIQINRILIALTQSEIQLTDESTDDDTSGPWMVKLESHVRRKDYPGIRMHAALLRAQFLAKQGRNEEAKEVLYNALEILDSPTVKTLRSKIQKMLDDLIIA